MNFYETLEVSQNASKEVIKAAYKSLMQRYHPDKHPGDAEVAAHALAVVQAYEVLSDLNKRAAYDLTLKQQSDRLMLARNDGRGGQFPYPKHETVVVEKKPYGVLWLLIAITIASSLFAIWLLKSKPGSVIINAETVGQVRAEQPRIIPMLISDVAVELLADGGFREDTTRVLSVPELGVRVGPIEAEKVIHDIENKRDLIRQKLEEKLVEARYDDLIKPDGEQYLKKIILDSINDTVGTRQYLNSSSAILDVSMQFGVIDIFLPRSFSVR